ncbi:MAG: SprB repeat-containing protein, partial [Bacteroidia bacterium]|nr:SprB repeat-containing protein [Bacteroidia bacterium]
MIKKLLSIAIIFLTFSGINAQTQFWSDTFEDTGAPSSGSRTPSQSFSCGGPPATNYFFRTNVAGIALQSGTYSSFEGSKFWAGEDIDFGPTCTNVSISANQQVTWSGLNISGKTGLSFRGLFAANGSFASNWEGSSFGANQDYLSVEYRIDGGAWTKAVAFYASTTAQSTTLKLETTGDLIGDGADLTYTFTEYTANIIGSGTTLDLRLNVFANGTGTEEIAVDNFRLFETAGCTNPTIGTQPTNKSVCFNGNTSFSIAATGASSYQWQENSGSGFTNITNGGIYSGATTSALSLTGVNFPSGYLYRCIAVGTGTCQTTSNSATLTVSAYFNTSSQTNVSCNGGSNGSATLNAAGGIAPYNYSWAPSGGTGATASGLVAGTYTVTVTDAISCSTTKTYTITQPTSISLTPLSQTNISCNGGSNGAASVNAATGGAGGYTYNWTPGNPTGDGTTSVSGLTAGTWSCTVTDANSCTRTQTFNITQPATAVSASNVVTNVLCFGASTGAINLTPSGGTAPYSFNWGGGIITEDRTGLLAGAYTCTVTDNNGCTTTSNATITQPASAVSASNVVTNVLCFGASTGAINLTPSGGTAPYTFNWGSGITTEDRTGLLAGTYNCTVTDNNGCTTTSNASITQPSSAVSASNVVTNVLCFGASTGAINLTPAG